MDAGGGDVGRFWGLFCLAPGRSGLLVCAATCFADPNEGAFVALHSGVLGGVFMAVSAVSFTLAPALAPVHVFLMRDGLTC